MRFPHRALALLVLVCLMAAPAATVCGQLAALGPACPMARAMGGDCHGGAADDGCCGIGSVPEPIDALAIALARPLDAPPAGAARFEALPAPRFEAARSIPADAFRHDLGRHQLYASLLL